MEQDAMVPNVLHRIHVKLYPNYLQKGDGAYFARTDNEAVLSIEQVCAALIKRGGYKGDYNILVDSVKRFMGETAYQLCDGFAVNNKYYTIMPIVGGTFNSASEVNDRKKHPLGYSFRSHKALRRLAENITVEVDGIAENTAYIDEFTDVSSSSVNDTLTPGGMFVIRGNKVKVSGEHADIGVYFEPLEGAGKRVRVNNNFAENTATKIIGSVPELEAGKEYRVSIVSQFSAGSSQLKQPRVTESRFLLSVE